MKITVFGATGEAGRQLVEMALRDGHEVTAFARNSSKLTIQNERLTAVQGGLQDVENIERAINGADAVINLLGPRPGDDLKSKALT